MDKAITFLTKTNPPWGFMNSFLILSIGKVMVIRVLKYNDQTATVDLHPIDWNWVIVAP